MDDALYSRYGLAKVTQIISKFYSEVLQSPRLRNYFDGVHIRTLVDHQSAFMTTAMGGPDTFTDSRLHEVHARLRITDEDFSEMIRLLEATLTDFGVEPADTQLVLERYERSRSVIVHPTDGIGSAR